MVSVTLEYRNKFDEKPFPNQTTEDSFLFGALVALEMCSVSCCPTQRKGKATSYPWKRSSLRAPSWRGEVRLRSTWSELGRPNWKPWKKPCTTAQNTDTWTSPSTYGALVSCNVVTLSDDICSFEHICTGVYVSFPPQGSPGLCTLGWSLCGRVSASTADLWSKVSWKSSAASRKRSTPRSWWRTASRSCFRSSGPVRYEPDSVTCTNSEWRDRLCFFCFFLGGGLLLASKLLNSDGWDVFHTSISTWVWSPTGKTKERHF